MARKGRGELDRERERGGKAPEAPRVLHRLGLLNFFFPDVVFPFYRSLNMGKLRFGPHFTGFLQ